MYWLLISNWIYALVLIYPDLPSCQLRADHFNSWNSTSTATCIKIPEEEE